MSVELISVLIAALAAASGACRDDPGRSCGLRQNMARLDISWIESRHIELNLALYYDLVHHVL